MNIKNYQILIITLLTAILTSCGEDRTNEYMELTKENQWIYTTMKEHYLWGDDIKQPEHSQFFNTTSKFFSSLLNSKDKVSYFTDTTEYTSYGILSTFMRDPIAEQPSKVYALPLFVEPNSPATIAGIQRGTWISAIDGKSLTISNTTVLQSGNNVKLTTEYIDFDDEEQRYFWVASDTLNMPQATEITSCNICIDSIYYLREKKIGYILCNNFNGDDFIEKAENILLNFSAKEITEIILDLRYNTGGNIENAATLASALVPTTLHGTPFAILKKNNEGEDTTYHYTPGKANLGDKKIYIITGSRTSGIAELFVSSLDSSRSMYDVLTIGEPTKGENLFIERIISPYGFEINPAVAYIYSASDKLLPTEGLKPNYPLNDLEQIEHIYPLGSEQEYLLYNTLHLIVTGMMPE